VRTGFGGDGTKYLELEAVAFAITLLRPDSIVRTGFEGRVHQDAWLLCMAGWKELSFRSSLLLCLNNVSCRWSRRLARQSLFPLSVSASGCVALVASTSSCDYSRVSSYPLSLRFLMGYG
jgi:hypothetical protein